MNRAAMTVLAPLSGLYGLTMKTRQALYRSGFLSIRELGAPVVSVGNLTTGGTGKTPLVEWIAKHLAGRQRRVCILTRGYGRANKSDRVIVSNGQEILSTPELAGDEPFLLAERLLGQAAVISDADRQSAARWALDNLKSGVFLLDDGFQNLRIARNLDIVTVDAKNPWGNGWLLPAGILREQISALSRADCVVISRADDATSVQELLSEIRRITEKPVLHSRMNLSALREARTLTPTNQTLSAEKIKATPVAAFCGIGNPQAFFAQLRDEGYDLVHAQAFRDHHIYRQSDIDRIVREAAAKGATLLLTTAKDEVKLRSLSFDLPCYVGKIEIEIEDDHQLTEMLEKVCESSKQIQRRSRLGSPDAPWPR